MQCAHRSSRSSQKWRRVYWVRIRREGVVHLPAVLFQERSITQAMDVSPWRLAVAAEVGRPKDSVGIHDQVFPPIIAAGLCLRR